MDNQRRDKNQDQSNTRMNIDMDRADPTFDDLLAEKNIDPYNKAELSQRWQNAGIGDDYIFAVVMRKANNFLPLMQRVLPQMNLTRVTRHDTQQSEFATPAAKSVRYDVYSEINGYQFVAEMQMRNSPNLVRRTRYYQSMLDIQNLRSGTEYRLLPDSCMIMICPFDLFGRGRHLYRFRNVDINDRSLELGDGADKIFLNSKGIVDDIKPELRNFLDLVNGKAPADAYCQQIAASVDEAKHSMEVMRMFMNVNLKQMEEIYEAREEARAEVRAEEQANTLRILCSLVNEGELSMDAALGKAAAYGVTSEADLRNRAQLLGIKL